MPPVMIASGLVGSAINLGAAKMKLTPAAAHDWWGPDVEHWLMFTLAAADRLTSAAMWTVVHMTYASRVDLSGAALLVEAVYWLLLGRWRRQPVRLYPF